MRGSKGFTLIEVLIVVVIIGVLASLILPRMLSAPEKARVAEGNQMLGTMIRAQQANVDTGSTFVAVADADSAGWSKLGMSMPSSTQKQFVYTCSTANTTCYAVRNTGTMALSLAGAWTCSGDYDYLKVNGVNSGGCTLK
jgi:prepilin-type N-terminal cleavage/methylation domain-containing protein